MKPARHVLLLLFLAITLIAITNPACAQTTGPSAGSGPVPATWMHDLKPQIGYLQLNQVALPGTHDSGTATLQWHLGSAQNLPFNAFSVENDINNDLSSNWCYLTWSLTWFLTDYCSILKAGADALFSDINQDVIAPWAQAQDTTIAQQLNGGIRFFDIRPCPNPNPTPDAQFLVCHGLYGESIESELQEVQTFSIANPDEIIILSISHETEDGITGTPFNPILAHLIVNTFSSMLISPASCIISLRKRCAPTSTLSDLWNQPGRVIVLYDPDALADLSKDDPSKPYLWDADNYYTPWPDEDGTTVCQQNSCNKGEVYFDPTFMTAPTPTQSVALEPAVIQNLTCGKNPTPTCPSVGDSDSGKDAAYGGETALFFGLQTQPTEGLAIVGGYLYAAFLQDIKGAKDACDRVLPRGHNCGAALAALRLKWGFAYGFTAAEYGTPVLPGNLHTLDQYANGVILQNLTKWITDTPALRQNLNIVLADYFEQTPNFVPSMIKLNTPPQSTLSIGVPQYGCPSNCFVASSTPFSISATDSNFGVKCVNYTYETPTGLVVGPGVGGPGDCPAVGAVLEFDIAAPAVDGPYTVTYWATNNAGLWGHKSAAAVTLDNTPPVITITQPSAGNYPHSATLTLSYNVTDGQGSGVKSFTSKMDGATTISGHSLVSGQTINLLTELPLGIHTFSVDSVDNVNNSSSRSVTFSIIVTAESIRDDVNQFLQAGAFKNHGRANSLLAKLDSAAAARVRGQCSTAANIYEAFINKLRAQSGKGVSAGAAGIMIADAQYLIAHCP